jgi:membrane-associated progesterone receptor component
MAELSTALPLFSNPVNVALVAAIAYLSLPLVQILLPPSHKFPTLSSQPDQYNWLPTAHPHTTVWRSFTPLELRQFDGRDGERILFAIKGKVYDVTAGRSFYGPGELNLSLSLARHRRAYSSVGGPYENFAGRDASRGMAKQSFELDMLTPVDAPIDDLADLTPSERDNMRGALLQSVRYQCTESGRAEWEQHFRGVRLSVALPCIDAEPWTGRNTFSAATLSSLISSKRG